MTLDELKGRYAVMSSGHDLTGIIDVVTEHPEVAQDPELSAALIHDAARQGDTALVALLVASGVNVNAPERPQTPERPIWAACVNGHTETARWLLEHGSDVNYEWDGGEPYCRPLAPAIKQGNFNLVKLLVEAGARVDVLDCGLTPLSCAIHSGHKEIEAYLRSMGGIEAHQAAGYRPPAARDPILDCIEGNFGRPLPMAWLPVVPDGVPVAVRIVFDGEVAVVFTEGMSARAMQVPPGREQYRHAELVAYLLDWPRQPREWLTPERRWPLTWMRRLAQYPFEHGTWLGGQTPIIANGEPPQPLGPGTEMTCWLLLAEKEPMTRFEMPDGRSVFFYEMVPIHTAERDYERKHGAAALLELFVERGVRDVIDPHRPSVA